MQTEKIKKAHQSPQEDGENSNVIDINVILDSSTKNRLTYGFIAPHDQCYTHALRIVHPDLQHIPVLIGSVPRQDQEDMYMRYCRLMLILFKPWRTAFDLQMVAEPWVAAFNNFKKSMFCPPEFQSIMDNMQLLHECKDHHTDNFRE